MVAITYQSRNLGRVMRKAEPLFNRGIEARRLVRVNGLWRLELNAPVSTLIDANLHTTASDRAHKAREGTA